MDADLVTNSIRYSHMKLDAGWTRLDVDMAVFHGPGAPKIGNVSLTPRLDVVPTAVVKTVPPYICPMCNMGDGWSKRSYNKTKANSSTSVTPVKKRDVESPAVEYRNVYKKPATFDNHILKWHHGSFKRSNSSEYICCLCQCLTVSHGMVDCTVRFQDLKSLLHHLRSSHSREPERLEHNHHWCAPMSLASYPPIIHEKAIEDFGGMQEGYQSRSNTY
ncbi:hypothetical protein OPT61_g4926 [Boeremia exigua]|uniref:Uncharacterized protein n=1 Tax=Boeremia exigua TaxID=749465 RepID=A0ACC2IC71_9PLEO|nr:hypothetical protein OPT61_g4926 [Boeremia exigua]